MASNDHSFTFLVAPVTEAQLVARITKYISDWLIANRHPDGVAPNVLAEDLVRMLRQADHLWTREDIERLEGDG